jgi:O-antigen ligase
MVERMCDGIVKWGLAILIAFTPLAFGTVEDWSLAIMEWGLVTLALVHILARLWTGASPARARRGLTGIEIPAILFLGLCAAQTIPMPMAWLRAVSPEAARMYTPIDATSLSEAHRIGPAEEIQSDPVLNPTIPVNRPISLRPGETWKRWRLAASLVALFFLVAFWADRRERVVFLIITVTTVGFLVAVEGLVQYLSWNGKIYWIRKVPPSSPFGPFVNHNHFAGYVEMVIPVAISLAFYLVALRSSEGRSLPSSGAPFSDGWRGSAAHLEHWGQGGLAMFAAIILIVGLVFSTSRGGILSTGISGLILFMVIRHRFASRVLAWSVAGALLAVVVVLVCWIGADVISDKIRSSSDLPSEASFRTRLIVWEGVVSNLPGFVWVGAGLGAFEEGFAPRIPPGASTRWDKAHNDYLQFLWETGVVGTLILIACAALFARRYWWPALTGRGHPLDILRIGIAVALMSLALHSVVDFNLQIASNGFLCALLGGILIGIHRIVEEEHLGRPVLVREESSPG